LSGATDWVCPSNVISFEFGIALLSVEEVILIIKLLVHCEYVLFLSDYLPIISFLITAIIQLIFVNLMFNKNLKNE
jgi:hypothetical protein